MSDDADAFCPYAVGCPAAHVPMWPSMGQVHAERNHLRRPHQPGAVHRQGACMSPFPEIGVQR